MPALDDVLRAADLGSLRTWYRRARVNPQLAEQRRYFGRRFTPEELARLAEVAGISVTLVEALLRRRTRGGRGGGRKQARS